MKAVWKYNIELTDTNKFDMPLRTEILHVECQGGDAVMWALVNLNEKLTEWREFIVVETGRAIDARSCEYVGTFQLSAGTYIGHIFEIK